jgi:hypothetical protein
VRPSFRHAVSALTILLGCSRKESVPIRAEPPAEVAVDAVVDAAPDVRPRGTLTAIAKEEKAEDYLGYREEHVSVSFVSSASGTLVVQMVDRDVIVHATREPIAAGKESAAQTVSISFVIFPMESGIDPPGSTGFIKIGHTGIPRRFMHGYPPLIEGGVDVSPDPSLARTAHVVKKPVQCERDQWCELATWVFHKKGAPPDAGTVHPLWTLRAKLE